MAVITKILSALMKEVKSVFSEEVTGGVESVASAETEKAIAELELYKQALKSLTKKINKVYPYAKDADESYQELVYNDLKEVPAGQKYDGSYVDKLDELQLKATLTQSAGAVELLSTDLNSIATDIQSYLNEETSDVESAKLWYSKFVTGIKEHIPEHYTKKEIANGYGDSIMSQTMSAFRRWSEFSQAAIDLYGSQRLINATYEAVLDGKDAMEYMREIIDLNQEKNSFFGGMSHETVSVPYAGFFGGGFFL